MTISVIWPHARNRTDPRRRAPIGLGGALLLGGCVGAPQPSFDCRQPLGSVEALICQQEDLALLDRQLEQTLHSALQRLTPPQQQHLRSGQRDWLQQRDDCWNSDMQATCIAASYRYRIAELQARYALVHTSGPFHYRCDHTDGDRVTATFYATDPASAVATRGDDTQVLFLQSGDHGAQYQGGYVSLWVHGDEALIRWGPQAYGNPEMRCRIDP